MDKETGRENKQHVQKHTHGQSPWITPTNK